MVEVEVAHRAAGYVLVRVDGEVDLNTRVPLVEVLGPTVDGGLTAVVFDLCDVRFFSLAGVDWLGAAVAALTARGHAVRVVCADPGPVWRLLTLLGLERRWPVHHDVVKAVADLGLAT